MGRFEKDLVSQKKKKKTTEQLKHMPGGYVEGGKAGENVSATASRTPVATEPRLVVK